MFKPSGKINPVFVFFFVLFAAAIGGLSWLYQALLNWIPWIYLNALVVAGFALAVFFAVFFVTRLGKNRNAIVGVIAGLSMGAIGVGASHYFGYTGLVDDLVDELYTMTAGADEAMSRAELADEINAEVTFSAYINLRVETGWSLGRSSTSGSGDITGILVWIIWSIEALIMMVAGVAGGYLAAREPYCESCNAWMEEETFFRRDDLDGEIVERISSATTIEDVMRLPIERTSRIGRSELSYVGKQCRQCDGEAYLTVTKHWQIEKGGEVEDESEDLHSDILISSEHLQSLKKMSANFPAA